MPLLFALGDESVVVMDVNDDLSREEMRRREQVWGVVREPPAPRDGHQSGVTRATVSLDLHVRERDPKAREVRVVTFQETGTDPAGPALTGRPPGRETARGFTGEERVRSWVLPDFATTAAEFFE